MVTINSINDDYFEIEGIRYAKIYQPLKQGSESLLITNIYDTKLILLGPVSYSDLLINGEIATSLNSCISALLEVIYSTKLSDLTELIELKADKGTYSGSLSDLKTEVDTKVYSGAITYQTLSDLTSITPATGEGTPAKVANDPDSENNGYYSYTSSSWVKDTDYGSLTELEERIEILESLDLSDVKNGEVIEYGNTSNMLGDTYISSRDTSNDYLFFDVSVTGTKWIYTPEFFPKGGNMVRISLDVEFFNTGGATESLKFYVADQTSVGGNYKLLTEISGDGHIDFEFDPDYYSVYEDITEFRVWIANGFTNSGQEFSAKISNLSIYEIDNAFEGENISGDSAMDLFSSVDSALSSITTTSEEFFVSPSGNKYLLSVSDSGAFVPVPLIPSLGVFFGNSLLQGFGAYGMAASDSEKDYYYLVTEAIKTLNPTFSASRVPGGAFEALEDSTNVSSVIQSTFLDNLTGSEDLVVIQLGDNVNTDDKVETFADSAGELIKSIRVKCESARVFWLGMWYGSTEKYDIIKSACLNSGASFISLSDLVVSANKSSIGNVTKKGLDTRTLDNVTNVLDNGSNNITVTFEIGSSTYYSTFDVVSYQLNSGTLTYESEYEIITSSAVASHPGDDGMKDIANRFLKSAQLTDLDSYYS